VSLEASLVLAFGLAVLGGLLYAGLRASAAKNEAQLERLEREIRQALAQELNQTRQEQSQGAALVRQELGQTMTQSLGVLQQTLGAGQQALTQQLTQQFTQQLGQMGESNARRMLDVRDALDKQLESLQKSNSAKLEEMRVTVDEKLQATLQARLGESFKQVADRLEQVHKGLGEMQQLAQGVGDLKHLLTNVKTRGIFGEAQLGALLEQIFVAEQYAAQVATKPNSRERVDYAIKMPGHTNRGSASGSSASRSANALQGLMLEEPSQLWLPIDAKFPTEDFERLLDAQERADAPAAEIAGKALEMRIRAEAKSISEKYIEPPYTTDFAILFLPSESLYAEVLRRPGLMDVLQREYRITLAGPTTLLAMLNSLQMGFRTLALEKRSSEVWQVLGAVKTEFGKFGDVLAKVKSQTQTVLNTLDSAETRSRAMERALRTVEAMPELEAQKRLPED
jgi:DNA recombination protein RmuC